MDVSRGIVSLGIMIIDFLVALFPVEKVVIGVTRTDLSCAVTDRCHKPGFPELVKKLISYQRLNVR